MIKSILTIGPTPPAWQHAHTETLPPPYFTVGLTHWGLYSSPFPLRTYTFPVVGNNRNVASSDHTTHFHCSGVQSLWALVHLILRWIWAKVKSGFLRATLPNNPRLRRVLRIVVTDARSRPSGLINSRPISIAVNFLFFILILLIYRSSFSLNLRFLPLPAFRFISPVWWYLSRHRRTVVSQHCTWEAMSVFVIFIFTPSRIWPFSISSSFFLDFLCWRSLASLRRPCLRGPGFDSIHTSGGEVIPLRFLCDIVFPIQEGGGVNDVWAPMRTYAKCKVSHIFYIGNERIWVIWDISR